MNAEAIENKGSVFRGNLTKQQLFKFSEGSFLVSNSLSGNGKPVINEKIGSIDSRGDLWLKIKEAGANGNTCSVFCNIDDYNSYIDMVADLWKQKIEK